MIGDWFSKYEAQVRFCFVDTDNDKKLDRVFLAGAKDKADQAAVEITPVAFSRRIFQEDDDSGELTLKVDRLIQKKGQPDKVEFGLHLTKNGEDVSFSYIATVNESSVKQTYPTFKTNPKKVPYPAYFNDILGASVGIHAVDAAKGEATISVGRKFPMQLFKPVTVQVTYVYIYY